MRRLLTAFDPVDVMAVIGLMLTALGAGLVGGLGVALIVVGLAFIVYAVGVSIAPSSPS